MTWLGLQDRDFLSGVLRARPDVLHPRPRSLRDLANRLSTPGSVSEAVAELDGGALDVLVALRAFGEVRTRDGLAHLVGATTDDRIAELDRALRRLAESALVWPTSSGGLRLIEPLRQGEGELNLGRKLRPMLDGLRAESLSAIARRLGVEKGRSKADTITQLENTIGDPEFVRSLLDAMPPQALEVAESTAWHGPHTSPSSDIGHVRTSAGFPEHLTWLTERGLLVPAGGDLGWHRRLFESYEMPREVALALRGPEYRPALRNRPAPPSTEHREIAEVDQAATAAAIRFADGVDRLVELSGSAPLRTLKAGGVGVRELRRLAKSLRTEEAEVRLWLETGQAAGLLEHRDDVVAPGRFVADWRAEEPAERFARLLIAWWMLPESPWVAAGEDKPGPALLVPEQPLDRFVRQDLLDELCSLAVGSAPQNWSAVDDRVAWRRPMIHADADTIAGPAASIRRECGTVGALALDALSSFGHTLATGEIAALRETAARLMPRAQQTVLLQADLTATVTGLPSTLVAETLNRVATAESRDTASMWRFDPTSVRNGLDQGYTAEELLEQLAELSHGPLPQPLEYLIRDTARRFGELSVAPVACCVLAEEANLLVEVRHHRQLRDLGLRALAPTVLASRTAPEKTLHALRDAGYAPVALDEHGTVQLARTSQAPTTSGPPMSPTEKFDPSPPPTIDIPTLAATLLNGEDQADEDDRSPVEHDLNASRLTAGEQRILAHAIATATPVHIHYVDQNGSPSQRTITPIDYFPPWIGAFCHLRQAEREFRLERIQAASPTANDRDQAGHSAAGALPGVQSPRGW